ncbi:focadhesin-like [Diadema setosum]|uniref:focadhesin-like n=1 Tax=Diadema setosum TaxID=31175 RepID=UPI003B3AC4BB
METVREKLEFNSMQYQCSVLKEIVKTIKKKKSSQSSSSTPITATTAKIDELELLWSMCRDGTPTISSLCAHCLVDLCDDGILAYEYLLTNLINLLPVCQSMPPIVATVSDMLLMVVKRAVYAQMGAGGEVVPTSQQYYSMRKPPHPFISMLRSRPECWPSLLSEVRALLSQEDDRLNVEVLYMLKPFLQSVLLEPNVNPRTGSFRMLLMTCLQETCSGPSSTPPGSLFPQEVIRYLLAFLSCVQTETEAAILEAVHMVSVVMEIVASRPQSVDDNLLRHLFHHSLCLAQCLRGKGMDMSSMLSHLSRACNQGLQCGDGVMICLVGDLLLGSSVREQHYLLDLLLMLQKQLTGAWGMENWKLLLWPLTQVVSCMYMKSDIEMKSVEAGQRRGNIKVATDFVQWIANDKMPQENESSVVDCRRDREPGMPHWHSWHTALVATERLARVVLSNIDWAQQWLHCQQARVQAGDESEESWSRLIPVAVAIMYSFDCELMKPASTLVVSIAARCPPLAHKTVFLAMNCIGRMKYYFADGDSFMRHLPRLACHRFITNRVLRLIAAEDLGPKMLHLLTDLWEKQDPVFHILLQHLTKGAEHLDTINKTLGVSEMSLAIAQSVCRVCQRRPETRGKDLVPILSKILKKATGPQGTPAVCLALDALIALVKEEVVDVVSVICMLHEQFQRDQRPLVVAKWCELLGLVPEFPVDMDKYTVLSRHVLKNLCAYLQHEDTRVVSAALEALAGYNLGDFDINYLPKQVTKEVKLKRDQERQRLRQAREARGEEEEDDAEEEDLSVPGKCVIKLLDLVSQDAVPGVKTLLHSFLADELSDLPRHVFTRSSQPRGSSDSSETKSLAAIPTTVAWKERNNKQPNLRQWHSAGLLFSFVPGSDKKRDSRAARGGSAAKSQMWLDALNLRLAEVPVDSPDWLYIMVLPQAWVSFMAGALQAVIQGRRADIEMNVRRGHDEPDEELLKERLSQAWLWARDRLMEQLRTKVIDMPNAKANALLALAGLASAVSAHAMSLGDEAASSQRSATQFEGQKSWMTKVADSLMTVVDPTFTSQSVLPWCTSDGAQSIMATRHAQACAVIGLSALVPHLLTRRSALVARVVAKVTSLCPESHSVHCGVGAGLLLARLSKEHYVDTAGDEVAETVLLKAFDKLESKALDKKDFDEASVGCALGLGIGLAAQAHEKAAHARVHVQKVKNQLVTAIESDRADMDSHTKALVMCLSLITVACHEANLMSQQDAFQIASNLRSFSESDTKCPSLAASLALLVHSLASLDNPQAKHMYDDLHSAWLRQIQAPGTSTDTLKSSVTGLVFLMAGPGHLVQTRLKTNNDHQRGKLTSVVNTLTKLHEDCTVHALQHALPWLLGYLHLSLSSVTTTRSSVPCNYGYLEEGSLLRAAVELLLEAGRKGQEAVPSHQVGAVLWALHRCSRSCERKLPPLNLAALLNPIMRHTSYGSDEIYHGCMRLAIGQCASSQTTANFIAAWLRAPLYGTIKKSCQELVYGALPSLVHYIPLDDLRTFISVQLVGSLQDGSQDLQPSIAALCGLKSTLSVADPPQGVVNLLTETVQKLLELLPLEQESHCLLFSHLSDCAAELSLEDLIKLTALPSEVGLLKVTFIRAHLIKQGQQPLGFMTDCIDGAMRCDSESERNGVLWFLLTCLSRPSVFPDEEKAQFLQLVMLRLKVLVISEDLPVSASPQEHCEDIDYLFDVFAIAVTSLSSRCFPVLFGPHPRHYETGSQLADQPTGGLDESREEDSSLGDSHEMPDWWLASTAGTGPLAWGEVGGELAREARRLLPEALDRLMGQSWWTGMRDKMITWLIELFIRSHEEIFPGALKLELKGWRGKGEEEVFHMASFLLFSAAGCLNTLRHYPEFAAGERWMKVLDHL